MRIFRSPKAEYTEEPLILILDMDGTFITNVKKMCSPNEKSTLFSPLPTPNQEEHPEVFRLNRAGEDYLTSPTTSAEEKAEYDTHYYMTKMAFISEEKWQHLFEQTKLLGNNIRVLVNTRSPCPKVVVQYFLKHLGCSIPTEHIVHAFDEYTIDFLHFLFISGPGKYFEKYRNVSPEFIENIDTTYKECKKNKGQPFVNQHQLSKVLNDYITLKQNNKTIDSNIKFILTIYQLHQLNLPFNDINLQKLMIIDDSINHVKSFINHGAQGIPANVCPLDNGKVTSLAYYSRKYPFGKEEEDFIEEFEAHFDKISTLINQQLQCLASEEPAPMKRSRFGQ